MKRDILERLLRFSVEIIHLTEKLSQNLSGKVIARQIIRSATSVGANVEEAQDASSKKEFINKMAIALREARETRYWLRLMRYSRLIPEEFVDDKIQECREICAILTTIVKHAKGKS